MMNILRNRLRRIFFKLFILPCHGVEIGCNRKLSFTIFITKPDIPGTIAHLVHHSKKGIEINTGESLGEIGYRFA